MTTDKENLLALADSLEWKPIETAPRDGTRILLKKDGCQPFIGSYFKWHREGEYADKEKYPDHWGSDIDWILNPEPTHWIALPTDNAAAVIREFLKHLTAPLLVADGGNHDRC